MSLGSGQPHAVNIERATFLPRQRGGVAGRAAAVVASICDEQGAGHGLPSLPPQHFPDRIAQRGHRSVRLVLTAPVGGQLRELFAKRIENQVEIRAQFFQQRQLRVFQHGAQ